MPKNHLKSYISKLLIGFVLTSAGIFTICYACFEKSHLSDWYFWATVATVLICSGLFSLLSAFVHKIKADLIKKQKTKSRQKTEENNSY